jgi:hypothetical protein
MNKKEILDSFGGIDIVDFLLKFLIFMVQLKKVIN